MAIDRSLALDEPAITALLRTDHTGFLKVDGVSKPLHGTSEGEALQALIGLIQDEALAIGRPVRVTVRARTGLSILLAAPDGSIEEESFVPFEDLPQPWPPLETESGQGAPNDTIDVKNVDADVDDDADDVPLDAVAPRSAASMTSAPPEAFAPAESPAQAESPDVPESDGPDVTDEPEPDEPESPVSESPVSESPVPETPAAPESDAPEAPASESREAPAPPEASAAPESPAPLTAPKAPMSEQTRRDLLDAPSFLAPTTISEPAQRGFAGFLNKFGLHLSAGPAEKAERTDIAAVSRHFDAHRTISVINRKGGANKTPTVVNLAAVFARFGGGGVLAWDNNETMGTLGWRTEPGSHDSTVLDVLGSADELLDARAEFGQMSAFVHHQQADKFDVLRSDEDPSGIHEMSAAEVDVVHSIAAKYYRLIFMDSGNSDRAENWLRMIDHTDQLVVPTTTMEDRAQAALLTLQAVQSRSEKAADLARNAVVVVSEWQPKESSISQRMADDFRPYVRDVVIVPFDPALKAGRIQYDALHPSTRRAWLAAAAAVAGGL